MKFQVIFCTLMGGCVLASELPQSPQFSVLQKYTMPDNITICNILNRHNSCESVFFDKLANVRIANRLANKIFTREELVQCLHELTQPRVAVCTLDPRCTGKASLLIIKAQAQLQN